MKLIGIVGKSGSGKTTLSKMLKKNNNVEVIHIDEVKNIKPLIKKLPKGIIREYTNNMGEQFIIPNEKIMNVIYFLRRNKVINGIYSNILKIPQNAILKKQIRKYETKGKRCIIIERSCTRGFFNLQTD